MYTPPAGGLTSCSCSRAIAHSTKRIGVATYPGSGPIILVTISVSGAALLLAGGPENAAVIRCAVPCCREGCLMLHKEWLLASAVESLLVALSWHFMAACYVPL